MNKLPIAFCLFAATICVALSLSACAHQPFADPTPDAEPMFDHVFKPCESLNEEMKAQCLDVNRNMDFTSFSD